LNQNNRDKLIINLQRLLSSLEKIKELKNSKNNINAVEKNNLKTTKKFYQKPNF